MSFFSSRSRVLVDLNFIEVKCLSKEIIPEVVFDRYRALQALPRLVTIQIRTFEAERARLGLCHTNTKRKWAMGIRRSNRTCFHRGPLLSWEFPRLSCSKLQVAMGLLSG